MTYEEITEQISNSTHNCYSYHGDAIFNQAAPAAYFFILLRTK